MTALWPARPGRNRPLPLKCQHRAGSAAPQVSMNGPHRPASADLSRNCPQRPRRWGRAEQAPTRGPGRPARAAKPSGEGRRPGERREGAGSPARGRDGRLCRLARCAARHSRFSRPQAGRIPRSLAPQVSKSGSHRQKRRCEIQRRRPSSSELAMGPSVHRRMWRWSTVARTWPASPEMAMLQLDVCATRCAGHR